MRVKVTRPFLTGGLHQPTGTIIRREGTNCLILLERPVWTTESDGELSDRRTITCSISDIIPLEETKSPSP